MKLFIFLLFVGVSIGTSTILERIADYLRQLCPKSNICDFNDYMGDKIGDPDSCGTDCSCKLDCADNGNCCFESRTTDRATDTSTIYIITPISTIEDNRVQCLYPVTVVYEILDFWNFVSCNILSSPNGKNVSNENGSCADQKVAPWGSLYPVYSKQTDKIYINDLCAKEYNVTDGVLWTAILTCSSVLTYNTDIAEAFSFLEKGKISKFCRIYFKYPGDLNDIRSHVCFKDMIDHCLAEEFEVPSYLNATKEDISEACQSGLRSPYLSIFDLYANVFCLICSGISFNPYKSCAKNKPGTRAVLNENFAALLDPVAIATMTILIDKGPMACKINTHQNASHCRPVLCPSAQIRNTDGQCVFPAKVWYQRSYSIAVELRSEQKIDLKEAFHWQDNKSFISDIDIQPFKVSNSMKHASWNVDGLLYDSKNLDTSRTTNTLVVILHRYFNTSDPADIIRDMSRLIIRKWLLPYQNGSLVLKPSLFKLKNPVKAQDLIYSSRFNLNDSYSEIYLSYTYLYLSGQPGIQSNFMTQLYFCEQVELGIGEYIISTDQKVLYNTFSNNYLFDGEFDFNYGISDVSVKICYETSGFVKSIVACANVHTHSALCCLYLLQVFLCFVFLQRHFTF